jgi:hypothetical protein
VGVGGLGGYGSSGVGGGGGLGLSLPATAVDDDADESENHQAGRVKRVGSGMKHMSDSGYAGHSSSFLANASHTVAVNDADMFPYAGPLLAATRPRVVRWQTQTPQPHWQMVCNLPILCCWLIFFIFFICRLSFIYQPAFPAIVPVRASWFHLDHIHEHERAHFAAWFRRLKGTDRWHPESDDR